ncbi:MAG: DNA polymerase III subunit alpha [bacterium]|nr:DNA polymerase III subunit alpha [bacterium]
MYVPLRVHGYHSMLTGVDAPEALLSRAAGLGLDALALADVGTLAGLVDFLQAARTARVRPIVAAELADTDAQERPGRLVALVQTEAGYRNLCRLITARHLDEDFDLVRSAVEHREGLVFLADHPRLLLGLFGRVADRQLLAAISPASIQCNSPVRDPRDAHGGSRNTYLLPRPTPRPKTEEPPSGIDAPDAAKTPPPAPAVPALTMIDAARATGVATVAVPDVYSALPAGMEEHRVRVAIKHNALLEGLPKEWTAPAPAHLPSHGEMCAFYEGLPDVPGRWPCEAPAGVPAMVARTRLVADTCGYLPPLGGVFFPEVELEEDETPYSKLCELAFAGARRRYRPLRPEVVRRLDYELSTIQELGYAPYFLLVQRIAQFATDAAIPSVGRGSAADSLVAYALGLTDADPLRYRLPFERFLNPARRDRPDIDLDFCWRRRDEVLEHTCELFGHERTAMICTLNRFGLRAAFREACLVHGIPPAEIDRWSPRLPMYLSFPEAMAQQPSGGQQPSNRERVEPARSESAGSESAGSESAGSESAGSGGHAALARVHALLPPALARNPVAQAFAAIPEARDFPFGDERFERALRSAAQLLDAPRHYGLHPGGVVVAPGAIVDLVPCQRSAKGAVVTQLDKNGVEALGLVKMDLLGNRALTTIDDCLQLLARRRIEPDLEYVAEQDPLTAQTLREGRTLGCFQVESPGMRHLLQQIGAQSMDDVIQAVALIRPGPAGSGMKDAFVRRFRGREDPTPPHPRLVDVLWDTHGVMLYQEDVMQAAACVAGMDLAEADQLRRALQKRRTRELPALRERFLAGCRGEEVDAEDGARVWDLIANFASFAFCKAHAVTYGRIAYRAVWLKTRYPAEFLAAFLASETGYYPARVYVEEARRLGVPILAPDVNKSGATFAVEEARGAVALRIGLGQARGLSQRTLERILEARRRAGSFVSLPDFLERTEAHTDEARTLVQCGAMDTFDRTRPELLWRLRLLRGERRRAPHGTRLDPAQLAACRATARTRERSAIEAARVRPSGPDGGDPRGGDPNGGGGWGGPGLGVPRPDASAVDGASLFPEPDAPALVLPGLPDTDAVTRGRLEFDLLGLTLHSHPTELFPCPADERIARRFGRSAPEPARGELRPVNPIACARLGRYRGGRVTLRGWPAATRQVRTENAGLMRFLTLEDTSGLAEVVLFPHVYARDGHRLAEHGTVCVTGVVEDQLGACTLHAERLW